ncbi:hypothetical protein ANO11243_097300 [Dothideomycetidae sp. 11243]|nr:hypothetical protein ANO11243_097300 [fungal sp. No.11243]
MTSFIEHASPSVSIAGAIWKQLQSINHNLNQDMMQTIHVSTNVKMLRQFIVEDRAQERMRSERGLRAVLALSQSLEDLKKLVQDRILDEKDDRHSQVVKAAEQKLEKLDTVQGQIHATVCQIVETHRGGAIIENLASQLDALRSQIRDDMEQHLRDRWHKTEETLKQHLNASLVSMHRQSLLALGAANAKFLAEHFPSGAAQMMTRGQDDMSLALLTEQVALATRSLAALQSGFDDLAPRLHAMLGVKASVEVNHDAAVPVIGRGEATDEHGPVPPADVGEPTDTLTKLETPRRGKRQCSARSVSKPPSRRDAGNPVASYRPSQVKSSNTASIDDTSRMVKFRRSERKRRQVGKYI